MNKTDKEPAFSFLCSKQWDELTNTGDDRKRYCSQCNKSVFLAENNTEFGEHAQKKRCVAILRQHEVGGDAIGSSSSYEYMEIGEPRTSYSCDPESKLLLTKQGLFSRLLRKAKRLFFR